MKPNFALDGGKWKYSRQPDLFVKRRVDELVGRTVHFEPFRRLVGVDEPASSSAGMWSDSILSCIRPNPRAEMEVSKRATILGGVPILQRIQYTKSN